MKKGFLLDLHLDLMRDLQINYHNPKDLLVVDLVTVMSAIYCVDVTVTARKSRLKVDIPVYNIKLWNSVKHKIETLLLWVSSENFTINFIENIKEYEVQTKLSLDSPSERVVTLFSGGLDSLTGAYKNYEDKIESDYIGFLNKDEEASKQRNLAKFYRDVLKPTPEIILIEKPIPKKKYLIQSTRSLLYLALAIAKAYYNNSTIIYLYENGILSLNPTLNNRFTTKTTHPKTIIEYNELLQELGINITIKHPFIFNTKGEKIEAMNASFKSVIKDSFTCGAGRSNEEKNHKGQCGVCIPCLLRKVSIAAYDNEEYDSSYYIEYDADFNGEIGDIYKNEYISNLNYMETYVRKIKDTSILQEIKIKAKYFDDNYYLVNTMDMLNRFTNEFERFKSKYGINRHSHTH